MVLLLSVVIVADVLIVRPTSVVVKKAARVSSNPLLHVVNTRFRRRAGFRVSALLLLLLLQPSVLVAIVSLPHSIRVHGGNCGETFIHRQCVHRSETPSRRRPPLATSEFAPTLLWSYVAEPNDARKGAHFVGDGRNRTPELYPGQKGEDESPHRVVLGQELVSTLCRRRHSRDW